MTTSLLTKREIELEQLIYLDTYTKIEQAYYSELGVDAYNLSLDLFSDRANISRTLNNLTREGHFTKLNGRPTLFISKRAVLEFYPDLFLPQSLANHTALENYIKKNSLVHPTLNNEFESVIGSRINGSLYQTIQELKSAVSYPDQSLDILLSGSQSSGKQTLINALIKYTLARQIIKHEKDIFSVDCYHFQYTADLIPFLKRHALKNQKRRIFILKNVEILEPRELSSLKNLIINRTTYNEETKRHEILNCSFILSTNEDMDFVMENKLNELIPVICSIVPFNEKTIEEKLLLIILLFQKEVDRVNRTIKLNKNIINCFVMSHYEGNIFQLKNSIRSSLSKALIRTSQFSSLVEIKFEDLSDYLLNNITTDQNQINTLYKLHEYNEVNSAYLYPNTQSEIFSLVENRKSANAYNSNGVDESETITTTKTAQLLINRSLRVTDNTTKINPLNLSKGQIDTVKIANEKLKWGIFSYMNEIIDEIKNDEYNRHYLLINNKEHCNITTERLVSIVQDKFKVTLPSAEMQVINEYIEQSQQIENNITVKICVFTNFKTISENYDRFANSLKSGVQIEAISAQFLNETHKSSVDRSELFANFINKMDLGKGVLVLMEPDLEDLYKSLSHKIKVPTISIPNLNIHTLEQISRESADPHLFLDDFSKYKYELEGETSPATQIDESMISLIEREILTESLLFLNPQKILSPCIEIFNMILLDLDLPYTEIRAVKFITHVSFMVERIVRGDKLSYKNTNEYVAKHGVSLATISKRMQVISDIFGLTIPQEELIYITDMFIS